VFGHGYFGSGYFGSGYFGPGVAAAAPVGRSKYFYIGGIPIPFEKAAFDYDAYLYERRRQQLHEDQIAIDVIVQAVISRILK